MAEPWRLTENEIGGFFIGLDETDVYRNYDSMMKWVIVIPRSGIEYHWNRDELELKSLVELQAIATTRGLGAATDSSNLRIWQNIILNSQRVPVHFSSSAVGWGGQQYSTGEGQPITVEDMVGIPNVRFPAIAITRISTAPDIGRDVGMTMRRLACWRDGEVVLQGDKPIPVNFTYQVDALSLETKHHNKMQQWFLRNFWAVAVRRRRLRVEIDHGDPWGFIPVYMSLTNYQDTSQLTAAANSPQAEKLLRFTFTVVVEGWLPGQTWAVPTVQRTVVEIREGTQEAPGEIISTATLGSPDPD